MTELNQKWKIGDCQDLMQDLESDSIDLIVTDPPYGYSFLGMDWDKAIPPVKCWKECLRILKPGAFAFIMSSPRQDVLAHNLVNLSDAGFETGLTSIYWTYASGLTKAGNIGKLVDNRLGAEREIIGKSRHSAKRKINFGYGKELPAETERFITTPATPEAKELDGSYTGFNPKPAVEIIMVVMKPLSEKTYVDQALVNGKGITWLDDGRIPYQSDKDIESVAPNLQGRFPANLLVSDGILNDSGSFSRYFDLDMWMGKQIKQLPKEAQKTFPFLIAPKASKSEKGADCTHLTVKPVKLISWLITIGSRKNDLVLDPFLGSGTTLEAGRFTDRRVLGFEISDEWEHLYPARCMAHQPPLWSYITV